MMWKVINNKSINDLPDKANYSLFDTIVLPIITSASYSWSWISSIATSNSFCNCSLLFLVSAGWLLLLPLLLLLLGEFFIVLLMFVGVGLECFDPKRLLTISLNE